MKLFFFFFFNFVVFSVDNYNDTIRQKMLYIELWYLIFFHIQSAMWTWCGFILQRIKSRVVPRRHKRYLHIHVRLYINTHTWNLYISYTNTNKIFICIQANVSKEEGKPLLRSRVNGALP